MDILLGCVPYLNAAPLVEDLPPGYQVEFRVPSELPELLHHGAAAILVSSIEALRTPGARVADSVAIASEGAVESVRIFHRGPIEQIKTLALDPSSMTSNLLAQVWLRDRLGLDVRTAVGGPDLEASLQKADAAVLIGDAGMREPEPGVRAIDLGEAWLELTGLPFIWALWVGGEALTGEVVGALDHSRETGLLRLPEREAEYAKRFGFELDQVRHYLRDVMQYRPTERHWQGLAEFARRIESNGLAGPLTLPTRISSPLTSVR